VGQLIEEAMRVLDEQQRRTIQMVFFEGMSLREVAEQTDESFSKIRNQYYRGLDRLRSSLTPQSVALRNERVSPVGEVSRVKA
jgi:RNA polymerase sigma factor (sigma-70 family)